MRRDGLFLKDDISKKIPLSIVVKEWGITPWVPRYNLIVLKIVTLGTRNSVLKIWKIPRSMRQGGSKVKDDEGEEDDVKAYQFLVLRMVNDYNSQ